MRKLAERLGLVKPRTREETLVRSIAMAMNEDARQEIHDSRERRAVLQLRLEHLARTKRFDHKARP